MTDEEKLDKLHGISMRLLLRADEAMKKAGTAYMLDAGTLLGAVRHKSFIPWDDDADICMLRSEYDRFLKCGKEYFDGDFELIIPAEKGDNAFYDFVPKIIYKKAVIDRESDEYKFYNGRYSHPSLDIFVIDRVPESKTGQRLHTGILVLIYGLAMGHRERIDYSKYAFAEKTVIAVLSHIGRFIPLHKIARLYDGAAKMFAATKKKRVMSTHSAMDAFGDCYEYDWYEKSVYGTINDHAFPIPQGYEGILTKHYGDYMSPPPEERRKPKHLSFDKIEFL